MSINEMIMNAKQNAILNATLGTATHFMCMAGMSWKDEVAKLCNTGGELDEWKSSWSEAETKASRLMREKRDAAAKDAEALSRVRALLEQWEKDIEASEKSGISTMWSGRVMAKELREELEGEEAKR